MVAATYELGEHVAVGPHHLRDLWPDADSVPPSRCRLEIDGTVLGKIGLATGTARLEEVAGVIGCCKTDAVEPGALAEVVQGRVVTEILDIPSVSPHRQMHGFSLASRPRGRRA